MSKQIADVHPVDVSVGGDHHPVVAQPVEPVLDAEGAHDVVELLVLVDRLAAEAVGIEGLALERVDGLGLNVACLDHGAAGRVALGQEDGGFIAPLALGVREVDLAVDELRDPDRHLLGALSCLLLDG